MHWLKFLIFNALGGAGWVVAWTVAGFYLGTHEAKLDELVQKLGVYTVLIAVSAAALLIGIIWHRTHRARAL
jgi:membrane protein DedA with SNARE-associated domain